MTHIDAIEGYVTFFGVVQTARQLQHGTFTAADASEDTDFFTGSDVDAQLINRVVAFVFVFERYVFKSDIALNVIQSDVFALRAALDRTGNNVIYASQCQLSLLEAGSETGNLSQWRQRATGQDDRGNQRTHGNPFCVVVGMNQIGTDNDQKDGIKLLHSNGEVDHEVAGIFYFDR